MEMDTILGRWLIDKDQPLCDGQVQIDGKDIKFYFTDYQGSLQKYKPQYKQVISTETNKGSVTLLNLNRPGWSLNPMNSYKRYTFFVDSLLIGTTITKFDTVYFQLENLTRAFRLPIESTHKQLKKQQNITLKLRTENLRVNTTSYQVEITSRALTSIRDMSHSYDPSVSIKLTFNKPLSVSQINKYITSISELFAFVTNQYSLPKKITLFNKSVSNNIPTELISKRFIGDEHLYDHIDPLFPLRKKKTLLKRILHEWPEVYKRNSLYFNIFNNSKRNHFQYLDNIFFNEVTIADSKLQNIYGKKFTKAMYSRIPFTYIKKRLSNPKIKDSCFKDRILKYLYFRRKVLYPKLYGSFSLIKIRKDPTIDQIEFISDLIIKTRNDIAHGSKRRYGKYLWPIWEMTWIITLDLLLVELGLTPKQATDIINNQRL